MTLATARRRSSGRLRVGITADTRGYVATLVPCPLRNCRRPPSEHPRGDRAGCGQIRGSIDLRPRSWRDGDWTHLNLITHPAVDVFVVEGRLSASKFLSRQRQISRAGRAAESRDTDELTKRNVRCDVFTETRDRAVRDRDLHCFR